MNVECNHSHLIFFYAIDSYAVGKESWFQCSHILI